jgi:hypothetical protein
LVPLLEFLHVRSDVNEEKLFNINCITDFLISIATLKLKKLDKYILWLQLTLLLRMAYRNGKFIKSIVTRIDQQFKHWNIIQINLIEPDQEATHIRDKLQRTFIVAFNTWKRVAISTEMNITLSLLVSMVDCLTIILSFIFKREALYAIEFAVSGGFIAFTKIIELISVHCFGYLYNKNNIEEVHRALDTVYKGFACITGLTSDYDEEFLSCTSIIPLICMLCSNDKRTTSTLEQIQIVLRNKMIASLPFRNKEMDHEPLFNQFLPWIGSLLSPLYIFRAYDSNTLHDIISPFHCTRLVIIDTLLRIRESNIRWKTVVENIGEKYLLLYEHGILPSAQFAKHIDQYILVKQQELAQQKKKMATKSADKPSIHQRHYEILCHSQNDINTSLDKILNDMFFQNEQRTVEIVNNLNDIGVFAIDQLLRVYKIDSIRALQDREQSLRERLISKYGQHVSGILMQLKNLKYLHPHNIPTNDVNIKKVESITTTPYRLVDIFPPPLRESTESLVANTTAPQNIILTEADGPIIMSLIESPPLVDHAKLLAFDDNLVQLVHHQRRLVIYARTNLHTQFSLVDTICDLLENSINNSWERDIIIKSINKKMILQLYDLAHTFKRTHDTWRRVTKKAIHELENVKSITSQSKIKMNRLLEAIITETRKTSNPLLSTLLKNYNNEVAQLSSTLISILMHDDALVKPTSEYLTFMKNALHGDTIYLEMKATHNARLAEYLVQTPQVTFLNDGIGLAFYELSTDYLAQKVQKIRKDQDIQLQNEEKKQLRNQIIQTSIIIKNKLSRKPLIGDQRNYLADIVLDNTIDDVISTKLYETINNTREEVREHYEILKQGENNHDNVQKPSVLQCKPMRDTLFDLLRSMCGWTIAYTIPSDDDLSKIMRLLAYDYHRIKLFHFVIRKGIYLMPDTVLIISKRTYPFYKLMNERDQYAKYKLLYAKAHYPTWNQQRVHLYEWMVKKCVRQLLQRPSGGKLCSNIRMNLLRHSEQVSRRESEMWHKYMIERLVWIMRQISIFHQ